MAPGDDRCIGPAIARGEDDAGEGDDEADSVVKEVFPGKNVHRLASVDQFLNSVQNNTRDHGVKMVHDSLKLFTRASHGRSGQPYDQLGLLARARGSCTCRGR